VPHSILIVDDDELIRGVTSEMLRAAGFEVSEAATGADGLRLARGHPDLVVMDVHLPDMDGYEVCRQLKGHPETAAIPVLYLSGTFREIEDRVRGLEMGGDGYLTKPVGAAELVATVRALLRMRQAEAGFHEAEVRRRAAETLVAIARTLAQSLDPREVAQGIVDAVRELLGAAASTLYRLEPSGHLVSVALSGDVGPRGDEPLVMPPGTGVSGLAVRDRAPVVTSDALSDPRIVLTRDTRRRAEQAPLLRAVLAVPLIARGVVIGALAVGDRAGRRFADEETRLAQTFADQAALALENARLYEEAERRRRELEVSEERYREMQQTLRAVIDAMPVMINAKDRECRYLFMNRFQAALYGVTEDEAVGKTAGELLDPGYGRHTEALDRRVLETGTALPHYEEDYADAHGVRHTWLTTKVPLRDGLGHVKGVATIALDLTDRKQLEAQLRQAQKMEAIGRLAGGVAHDFNNLLTVITGRSQILLARLGAEDPARRQIDLILKTAEQAAALTRQLLAFSRKQVLQPKVLDPNRIVSRMKKMLRRLIGEHIELVTETRPGLGHVRADPGQLEQVMLNLVVNARDAMPEGGRLTVETADAELDDAFCRQHPGARAGPHVMLAVSDTGVGIDGETQAHLFEPFFTTKGVGKGTGLGLATVYGIVKQSGGYVAVTSAPGHGARFEIYLPRVDEPLSQGEDELWPEELLQGRETILLAEDQPDVRELARDVLQLSGYSVLEAKDGAEALELAERERAPVHLLLTDVVMPQMSGRELAARLRARHPGLRVLFMSGYTDDAIVRQEVLESGTAFLQKPFTPDALGRKVRELLDSTGGGRRPPPEPPPGVEH
jgi:PAS domain S-box-containing protein